MNNEELLQAISDMMDKKLDERFQPVNARLDKMESGLNKMEGRLDKMESRLNVMEVKQNKMHDQLTELLLSQKLFEMNANKKFARLQDGMDTIEEILKINELIPR